MKSIKRYVLEIQFTSNIILLFTFGILIFLNQNRLAFGFLLGGLTSAINFGILFLFTAKAVKSRFKTAFVIAYVSFLIRMLLIFAVMINTLKIGLEVFFSSAIGLILIKVVIISNTIFGRWNKWNFFQR